MWFVHKSRGIIQKTQWASSGMTALSNGAYAVIVGSDAQHASVLCLARNTDRMRLTRRPFPGRRGSLRALGRLEPTAFLSFDRLNVCISSAARIQKHPNHGDTIVRSMCPFRARVASDLACNRQLMMQHFQWAPLLLSECFV